MAQKNNKRPENLRQTLRVFLSYLGRHKRMLFVVAVLVSVSATANLLGTYMIRPVVNNLADGKDIYTYCRCGDSRCNFWNWCAFCLGLFPDNG